MNTNSVLPKLSFKGLGHQIDLTFGDRDMNAYIYV
jgi:hypothetical protein